MFMCFSMCISQMENKNDSVTQLNELHVFFSYCFFLNT